LKKVSVIIPTYNRSDTLKRAIETCISQTYKDIEIIIVDDTKKSQQEMIDSYHDDRIVYVHNANPQGSPIARNIGIRQSKGEYIAFLDDDDEWYPTKIEKQMQLMMSHPNIGLVICYSLDKRFGKERINMPPEVITHRMALKSFNLSSTSSYLVRKDSLIKIARKNINNKIIERMCGRCVIDNICWEDYRVGIWNKEELRCEKVRKELEKEKKYFDTSLPSAQEYDLAIRLSKNYKVCCIPEVLMIQYSSEGQISENWSRKIKGIIALYGKYHKEYGIIDHVKTVGLLGLFSFGFLLGNRIYNVIIPMKERYEGR